MPKHNINTMLAPSADGEEIYLPVKATAGAAGYDVRAAIPSKWIAVMPGKTLLIPLGFKMDISNPNLCGLLMPRSGLSHAEGIILSNAVGLLDSDYQGEVFASIHNRNRQGTGFIINRGDRLAQLLFVPVVDATLKQVDKFTKTTRRGSKGFNSTGTK